MEVKSDNFGEKYPDAEPANTKKKVYYLNDKKTNTIIYMKDSNFYVNRSVLSNCSSVFKTILENTKNNKVIKIPIKDHDSEVVYEAMKFIHAPSYMKYQIEWKYTLRIIPFAFQYDIKTLYENQASKYKEGFVQWKSKDIVGQYSFIHQYKLQECEKLFVPALVVKIGKQGDLSDTEIATIISLNQSTKDDLLICLLSRLQEIRKKINIEKQKFIDSPFYTWGQKNSIKELFELF
jgi:hypothetical protein